MDSRQCLTQAYSRYYYAFIKKAMQQFGDQKDKAFDCIQEIMLRLLKTNYPFESVEHAAGIINKSIMWESYRMKTQRKKWGAFRERSYDFANQIANDRLAYEVQPSVRSSLNYWPQSNAYFQHIKKLNPYHQLLLKMHMLGIGNKEASIILNKNSKDDIGSSKDDAFKMLRNFRVANKLRSPLERSKKRQGSDDRTDRIMEMTAAGTPDKEIAKQLGLTVNNVKCRRFDRQKLLKKIKNQNGLQH